MPSTSAARRASRESSSEQQPRAPSRWDAGEGDNARWTPVTSCPAATARAAATALSTPPDMAASTFIAGPSPQRSGGAARPLDRGTDGRQQGIDVTGGGGVTEREPQRATRSFLVVPHGQQHMARSRDAGRARRAGGTFDAA